MTADQLGLLAAIITEPENDSIRGMFADAATDAGKRYHPDLIRGQLQTHWTHISECFEWDAKHWRWGTGGQPSAHIVPELGSNYEHDDANSWLPPPVVGACLTVSRGFAEVVECDWKTWLALAPSLHWHPSLTTPCPPTAHPVRLVKLTDRPPSVVRGIPNGPDMLILEVFGFPPIGHEYERYSTSSRMYRLPKDTTRDEQLPRALACSWPGIEFEVPPVLDVQTMTIGGMAYSEAIDNARWSVMRGMGVPRHIFEGTPR